jgi:hypothetical protein
MLLGERPAADALGLAFRVARTIPDCIEGRPDAGDEYRESVRYDVAVVVRTIVALLGETDSQRGLEPTGDPGTRSGA